VQHLQKALTQMNVQIQHVISDLTGLTGLAILDGVPSMFDSLKVKVLFTA